MENLHINIPCSLDNSQQILKGFRRLKSLHLNLDIDECPDLLDCKSLKSLSLNCDSTTEFLNLDSYEFPMDYGSLDPLPSHINWDSPTEFDSNNISATKKQQSFVSMMKNLPNIHSLSLEGFQHLPFCKLSTEKRNFSSMLRLHIEMSSITVSDINTVVTLMPNIADICIRYCTFLDTSIFLHLARLRTLVYLRIPYLTGNHLSFDSNVESCLISCGNSLKTLDLSGMRLVDMSVVGSCCSNIEELILFHCFQIRFNSISRNNLPQNVLDVYSVGKNEFSLLESCIFLKTLHLGGLRINVEDFDFSIIFKGSNNLKVLTFSNIWVLTVDEQQYFRDFFSKHSFGSVEQLDVSGNTAFGKVHLLQILKSFPSLKKLCFNNCNLTQEEYRSIQKLLVTYEANVDIEMNSI